ncbi:Ubiquitin-like superfamily protein [Striga hermonthica]|uniref:Ubiquitin-like superfamily protein n=1 Tax=Striga hermonthica TaxID=68872 RepID=A0A9N7R4T3_STRHE|nr:Ubiquitin-like superfamily protein [Striga hermonthica]
MENQPPVEGSGASDASGESCGSTLQLNIKTLDSRIFSFLVDKNIMVSAFKEKIAQEVSVPVGQQRLIFRGKVLKDDHLLSEYNVEHGDTLHLVERQPQPSPGSNTGEAASSNSAGGGQDTTTGGPRNRIGQISHSVVLGTLNVGDSGDAVVPDLSRVIGAVLNSIGIGNPVGGTPSGVQNSEGSETEQLQANAGSERQGVYQTDPNQASNNQSASHPTQNPVGATMAVPSPNVPIPDSLSTLSEFMNQMEQALSQTGTQQDQSPDDSGSLPTPQYPTNLLGFPTVEALTSVMRHAQRLLSNHVVRALSQAAGRLDQEGRSSDPAVRGQVHSETVQLGVAMQHLGALFLELGRTILNLRVGSSGESFVSAGPAVYISPFGPNPIMVQPFPLQTTSLFNGSSGATQNQVALGPPFGSVARNVNIHIHTGAALAPIVPVVGTRTPNAEEMPGQAQVPTGVNVTATAVPIRPAIISVSSAPQPGAGGSQATDPSPLNSVVSGLNAYLRNIVPNRQNENQAPSGGSANQEQHPVSGDRDRQTSDPQRNLSISTVGETTQTAVTDKQLEEQKTDPSTSADGGSHRSGNSESSAGSSGSSQGDNTQGGSSGVPLGLGLGGLQPKKRGKSQAKTIDRASSSRAVGQQVLQSLASLSTRENPNPPPSGLPSDPVRSSNLNLATSRQNTTDNIDLADTMSQVLNSSSLDGLLTGVSQQTGVGSPDMLRNMLQQFTQNPAMRNTMNQLAQQMDGQDLGSMFSGSEGGAQGGGFDLSRMMQQMMPIVSQALGGITAGPQMNPSQVLRRDVTRTNDGPQINFREVVQRLQEQNSSGEIFRSMVGLVARLNCCSEESLVNAICSHGLGQEFMDMFLHDLSTRLEGGM